MSIDADALRRQMAAALPAAGSLEPGTVAGFIERWPLDRLVPYARNARTHSSEQVAMLARSLEMFGWTTPLLVRASGDLIAGHGRVLAAKSLGWTTAEVRVIGDDWSEEKIRAYIIADNKIAEEAGWDAELLKLEFAALIGAAFDVTLTGFSKDDAYRLADIRLEGLADPDDAPAPPVDPVSRLGDVWILGPHRLMCGSSTDADDVRRLLAGASPHLMVTDPPYGVNYDPSWRVDAGMGGAGTAQGVVLNDDNADWREAWRLFPGKVAYVWHGGLHGGTVQASLEDCDFKLRAQIIWVKTRPVLSRGAYHWQHEPAFYVSKEASDDRWQGERFDEDHGSLLYAVKDGETAAWKGGRKQSTVWFIEHLKNDTGHGTQKPIECMRRPIVNNSELGDAIYEPFSGSGTTLMASHIVGRVCYAMELSPAYVDVCVRRWQEFTGEEALLEGGASFSAVARERGL